MITEHYLAALNIEGVGEHCPKTCSMLLSDDFLVAQKKKKKKKKSSYIQWSVSMC